MRRKRSSVIHHQEHHANIINVRAVVAGMDGVGKSGELKFSIHIRKNAEWLDIYTIGFLNENAR